MGATNIDLACTNHARPTFYEEKRGDEMSSGAVDKGRVSRWDMP